MDTTNKKRKPLSSQDKKKPLSRNGKKPSGKTRSTASRPAGAKTASSRRQKNLQLNDSMNYQQPAADLSDIKEKYRYLVERSLQGVLLVEGYPPKIIFANEALVKIFGYSVKEFLNLSLSKIKELIHPEDREIFFDRYRNRLSGKNVPLRYEFRIIRRDGSRGWIEMFASRMEDKNKPMIQATFIDVTERKCAEERLRQSEEKYRAIIDNIQEGYYEVDLAGNISFFNDAMAKMLGYTRNELTGLNNRGYMDDVNAKRVYQTFRRVFRTEKSERGSDWEIIRKDGSRRIIEASISLIKDAAGVAVGFRGIVRDVTEEKRIVQALSDSERRYRNVYNTAPLAFVLWDEHYRITDWNKHAEEVFGWTREEILGKDFIDILVPDRERPRIMDVAKGLLTGKQPSHIISENLTMSGDIITCEWNNTIFYDREGHVQEVLSLALDITERKNLEEELFQSRKMESIGRLAGGIAHDLNNMLTPIIGYADILLLDVPMDDVHLDSLIQIKQAAERARDLTRQLLAFSCKQVLEMKVMNLGKVVASFETILRRTIKEDIELEILFAPGAGNIMTDASQIEQILLNLAVNADEAMPDGGKLTIEVSNVMIDEALAKKHPDARPGRYVMLYISDTGCGMDNVTLEHMFEPFYTTRELGTGLGLATVYGIVKQHNGSIWASSRPNSGTTFRIYFPRADGEAVSRTVQKQRDTVSSQGETILIVEDEDTVRRLTEKILQKHGYRVFAAGNGDEAIDIAGNSSEQIDLLLTDVIMPGIDGKSLYREIAALRNGIKVLYMSGYTNEVIAHHGIIEEGVHFIQKPFSFQALTEKIREVLES